MKALRKLNFNTKKVRLKPRDLLASVYLVIYFNTKKVRLKPGVARTHQHAAPPFQYQKGAIKTNVA